jgi:hypothetical protein
LNEGIDPVKSSLDKNTLFDAVLAVVKNPDAYEMRERFDVDLGFIYAYEKDKNSFTKLQLFTSNSFRKYRDEENRPDPNGILFKDNSHWINYGVKLQQVLNYDIIKGINFISKSEIEYNKDLITSNIVELRKSERIYFLENIALLTKYFSVNAYAKAFKHAFFDSDFYFNYGAKPEFKLNFGKNISITLYGVYNKSNILPTYQQYFMDKYIYNEYIRSHFYNEDNEYFAGGGVIDLGFGKFKLEIYQNSLKNIIFNKIDTLNYRFSHWSYKTGGLNSSAQISVLNFDLDVNFTNRFYRPVFDLSKDPLYSGNISLAYHNIFFRNKLEVKIGIVSRFWSEYYAGFYNGFYNDFSPRLEELYQPDKLIKINPNATLDFFIIGKISKATFGLTFENLLNRLYITSGLYPYQNRGGLFNVISRFNVTWYFLN